jgi:hypothetical protein
MDVARVSGVPTFIIIHVTPRRQDKQEAATNIRTKASHNCQKNTKEIATNQSTDKRATFSPV